MVLSHSAAFSSGGLHTAALFGGRLDFGRLGVDLFFQISGFIIAIISLQGRALVPMVGAGAFFRRRFVRIIPLMWVSVIGFALLQRIGHVPANPWSQVRAMLLLPGELSPALVWTLRQELVFYVIFAISFLLPRRAPWLPWCWFVAIIAVPRGPGTLWSHDGPLSILLNLRNLGFAGGLILALIWLKGSRHYRLRSPVEPLVLLILASGFVMFFVVPMLGIDSGIGLGLALFPLVAFAAHVECPPGVARRIGELLGNASYAIYLFHYPAITVLIVICRRVAPAAPPTLVMLLCFTVSTAVGVAAYLMLERPLLKMLRRRLA